MNPGDDSDPNHWDIALLVSGVDFWGPDGRGGRSYITMGLATVTGICSKSYGCVIGEMGVSQEVQNTVSGDETECWLDVIHGKWLVVRW